MICSGTRERNPNREKAKQLWTEHLGNITNRKIAELLGENEKVVAIWKQRDKWNVVQRRNVEPRKVTKMPRKTRAVLPQRRIKTLKSMLPDFFRPNSAALQ
ncbi:hypothetical protein DCMF_07960 [Candidatus Formimonas warabiya]|uniref:PBSX phage terminase small subunit-like N-terminal domain-containing protein n=1 Tax=Formimonas warabiya TaxID=1761012 RepID=A0A3G1KQJ1_FORW1|nr:phage terminase small subunit-related protein [Candidatus Formimonas warabiya]ATW24718.1 hypothetical protein DCMF_07960 [Candidatus Formimonas warabiya]